MYEKRLLYIAEHTLSRALSLPRLRFSAARLPFLHSSCKRATCVALEFFKFSLGAHVSQRCLYGSCQIKPPSKSIRAAMSLPTHRGVARMSADIRVALTVHMKKLLSNFPLWVKIDQHLLLEKFTPSTARRDLPNLCANTLLELRLLFTRNL